MEKKKFIKIKDDNHCYFCGAPVKEEVGWDEYTKYEMHYCDCKKSKKYDKMKKELEQLKRDINKFEKEERISQEQEDKILFNKLKERFEN